jgi:hypothetical protein
MSEYGLWCAERSETGRLEAKAAWRLTANIAEGPKRGPRAAQERPKSGKPTGT